MRRKCICCRRPLVTVMLDSSDMCAVCARDTSAFLDKFSRGESVEPQATQVALLLFAFAFMFLLGAGVTWMARLI